MYVKEELKSPGCQLCRVSLSISEMNSVAEQPNLEMLGGFNFQWRGLATASIPPGQH